MAKIYTRTGDLGTTSLVGGKRVPKTHPRLEAYGTVDELSSHLGLLCALLSDERDKAFILSVQQTLFGLSALLATEPESAYQPKPLSASLIKNMEDEIDRLQAILPPLNAFIIPGGSQAAAQAHVCRTVCRRAERCILALAEQSEVNCDIIRYTNRLSDYLFVLARTINTRNGVLEIMH